jgi:hypothetical protein
MSGEQRLLALNVGLSQEGNVLKVFVCVRAINQSIVMCSRICQVDHGISRQAIIQREIE